MTLSVPYPADVRAKGWRFEIDYEKVEQSDTWSLAAEVPMAQHALLMMWMVAWTQVPCGSMPNDESLIRAKCRIPAKAWPALQPVLMRGWWLAEDGRLYHDTIVMRVREMLEYRRKNAKRVADFKAAKREQQAANALPPDKQQGENDTGTGTGTNTSTPYGADVAQKRAPTTFELPDWINRTHWDAWHSCPKRKKATDAQKKLAVDKLDAWRNSGIDHAAALESAAIGGWQGLFKPDEKALFDQPKPGKHAGFQNLNYREGIAEDGTFS